MIGRRRKAHGKMNNRKLAKILGKEISILFKKISKSLNIPIKPVVVGYTKDSLIINGGNYSEEVEYEEKRV